MSRVLIIEMPDKYQATTREVLKHIREKYPDAGLLLSTTFQWWRDYEKSHFGVGQLPIFIDPDKVDDFIKTLSEPQSYEERNGQDTTWSPFFAGIFFAVSGIFLGYFLSALLH